MEVAEELIERVEKVSLIFKSRKLLSHLAVADNPLHQRNVHVLNEVLVFSLGVLDENTKLRLVLFVVNRMG